MRILLLLSGWSLAGAAHAGDAPVASSEAAAPADQAAGTVRLEGTLAAPEPDWQRRYRRRHGVAQAGLYVMLAGNTTELASLWMYDATRQVGWLYVDLAAIAVGDVGLGVNLAGNYSTHRLLRRATGERTSALSVISYVFGAATLATSEEAVRSFSTDRFGSFLYATAHIPLYWTAAALGTWDTLRTEKRTRALYATVEDRPTFQLSLTPTRNGLALIGTF